MKKVYIHPLPVRAWHWINAFGFVFMIVTGLQLRYPEIFGFTSFRQAVELHNTVGFVLIANYFLWLGFYLLSDRIKIYHPELNPRKHFEDSIRQVLYYGRGIFRGDPNPHHSGPYDKFNPMQKMAYQVIMLLVVPVQFATGLLLWDVKRFDGAVSLLGGGQGGGHRPCAVLHLLRILPLRALLPRHPRSYAVGPLQGDAHRV